MSAPLDIAIRYCRRGWNPVPVPYKGKKPIGNAWQLQIIREDDAPRHFNGIPQNVGVALGASSRGLTDVDLDSAEAIALAPYFLPRTDAIFGRASKPASHWLYTTELAAALNTSRLAFKAPGQDGSTIVELRIGGGGKGAQTIFPGSVHPSGEPIAWVKSGEPAKVDGETLRRAVRSIAAAALLVRGWPAEGNRHDAALVLGGVLARAGASPEAARRFVTAVAKVAGDDELEDRATAAEDAATAYGEGKRTFGFPFLVETFGRPVAEKVAEWVGLTSRDEVAEPAEPAPVSLKASPFAWCDASTLPMREWIYGRHYIRKFVGVTVAPGGVGKSSLAIAESLVMVSGKDFLGDQTVGLSKVWYWNGEDPMEELRRRVMATAIHHGLTRDDVEGRLFLNSGRDSEMMVAEQTRTGVMVAAPVVEAIKATIRENGIDVVIIDPFVSSHRVTENDNNAIDRVAKLWARIADETGCAVELVHHARKTNGGEVTMEDGRGAVALLAAARSGRILNVMSQDEAMRAGVEKRRLHFRVDNGKANLAPPPEGTTWYRLASVPLRNGPLGTDGDSVGVVTPWKWPDALEGVSADDLRAAQAAVRAGGPWRENVQARDWVGRPIAQALRLDADDPLHREKIKRLLKIWITNGMFVVVTGKDAKGNDRPFVEVGEAASN